MEIQQDENEPATEGLRGKQSIQALGAVKYKDLEVGEKECIKGTPMVIEIKGRKR